MRDTISAKFLCATEEDKLYQVTQAHSRCVADRVSQYADSFDLNFNYVTVLHGVFSSLSD